MKKVNVAFLKQRTPKKKKKILFLYQPSSTLFQRKDDCRAESRSEETSYKLRDSMRLSLEMHFNSFEKERKLESRCSINNRSRIVTFDRGFSFFSFFSRRDPARAKGIKKGERDEGDLTYHEN